MTAVISDQDHVEPLRLSGHRHDRAALRVAVRAPGAPGSIEKGVEEQQGYLLKAVARPATAMQFQVTLVMVASSAKR